jgi:hypothetical protein
MRKSLTPELKYLEPVFKDMMKLFRRVDENYDTTLLLAVLAKRFEGLTAKEAAERLEADRKALVDWLADQPKHPGWFLSAFLESPEVLELARQSVVPLGKRMSPFGVPMPKVAVPPGYKLREEPSNLIVHKRSAAMVVVPMAADELEEFKELMVGEGAKITPFQVGSVSGSTWTIMGATTYAFRNSQSAFTVNVSNPAAVTPSELQLVLESLGVPWKSAV